MRASLWKRVIVDTFLVPLLYGGQEQIVRQMRDELLNSRAGRYKKRQKPHHGLHGVRSGLGWIFYVCLFVTGKPRRLRGRLVAQAGGCEDRSTLEEEVMGFVSWGVETHCKHGTCRQK